jgi:hypothetical protein
MHAGLAKKAYAAYRAKRCERVPLPLRSWQRLSEPEQAAWIEAARAVEEAVNDEIDREAAAPADPMVESMHNEEASA